MIDDNRRGKICIIFKTDTDTVEITVYRYRNDIHPKHSDIKLSVLEYEHFKRKIYIINSCKLSGKSVL